MAQLVNKSWTLDDALAYIRSLQPKFLELNYHLGLAGSVLNQGHSDNDLDIIIMGLHNKTDNNEDGLLEFLEHLGAFQISGDEYDLGGRILFRSYYTGKKIDWFFFK